MDSSIQTPPKMSPTALALLNGGRIVRTISSGCTSTVFIVIQGDATYVIKDTWDPHFADWLEREACFLRAIRDSALPHAKIENFLRDTTSASLCLSFLEGRTVTDLLAETRPAERSEIWSEIGMALRILHTTPLPPSLPHISSVDWLDAMLNLAERHLVSGRVDGGTAAILKKLRENKPEEITTTVIHGDCTTDNILFQGREFLGFIDFPFGGVGDRRKDLTYVLTGQFPPGPLDLERFAASYGLSLPTKEEARYFQDLYLFF